MTRKKPHKKSERKGVRCHIDPAAHKVVLSVIERCGSGWGVVLDRLILGTGEDGILDLYVDAAKTAKT